MSVTHLRWVKKKNTDTKKDTRIRKFFRKTMLFTPYTFTGKIICHFKWRNADLTSEVTSKMWRQNEEFDSLMSGFISNLKMYATCPGPVRL